MMAQRLVRFVKNNMRIYMSFLFYSHSLDIIGFHSDVLFEI